MMLSFAVAPVMAWEFDTEHVFSTNARNAYLDEMSYDGVTQEISFYISARDDSTFNIGLASFEVCFNRSYVPENFTTDIHVWLIIDGEEYVAQDQLKNFTYVENAVLVNWNESGAYLTRDCSYFQCFIYLFENQSIVNELPMESYLMWGDTVFNEGQVPALRPQMRMSALSHFTPAQAGSDVVMVFDFNEQDSNGLDGETWGIPNYILAIVVGILIIVLVILKLKQSGRI
jgi:hypothetical protein